MMTDAKKRANAKWNKENQESCNLSLPKGTKEEWKQMAESAGLSMTGFVREAVQEKAEREEAKRKALQEFWFWQKSWEAHHLAADLCLLSQYYGQLCALGNPPEEAAAAVGAIVEGLGIQRVEDWIPAEDGGKG